MEDLREGINNRILLAINQLLLGNGDLTKKSLAEALHVSPTKFSEILNRRMNAGTEVMSALVADYNISPRWLLTGNGDMKVKEFDVAVQVPPTSKLGIPLIPTEAFAGYGMESFDDLKIEEYYYVAEFRHADFLIRIKGNSMYPKYSSGDVIACKKIKETLFFQWNKIYAIYTRSQGVMVKRVHQADKDGYISLHSDNPSYQPFDVPLSDIEAIALVIGVIRVE